MRRRPRNAVCFLAVLLLASASADARPEAEQFTPEGLANLHRLVERARRGDLGDDAVDADFFFTFKGLSSEGAVRFDVVRRDGTRPSFLLLHPPTFQPHAVPRYFVLFPDDGIAPRHVARFTAVIDEVFTTNPWNDLEEQPLPAVAALVPVRRTRALAGFYFLLGSVIAGLAYLLFGRPPSDSERLT